jgi:hypothetical protein
MWKDPANAYPEIPITFTVSISFWLVRDSSAVRRLFFPTCWSRAMWESSTYGKQRICPCNSASTHFHVSWLSDFIFYPKPLYKLLHQSFFYSFITILPSESGVYTRLQHDFPLDPMISSFHIHFGTFVTWLRENYDYRNVSWEMICI